MLLRTTLVHLSYGLSDICQILPCNRGTSEHVSIVPIDTVLKSEVLPVLCVLCYKDTSSR